MMNSILQTRQVLVLVLCLCFFTTFAGIALAGTDVQVNDDTGENGQAIGPEKTAVVVKDTTVYAVWQDFRNVSDTASPDIYFAKGVIENNNVSFGLNVMVNDVPHMPLNDKPSAPAMAVGDNGNIYVVWTDNRNIDNQLEGVDVYFARSTNGGVSFEANQLIGSTTGGSGAAAIATAGDYVYVVYEHCCDPANNVLDFVLSADNGQSFSPLETIYIPQEGETGTGEPTIAAQGSNVFIAFQLKTTDDGNKVACMNSNNYGGSFSDPLFIYDDEGSATQSDMSIAVSGENVYVTWHDVREPAGVYFSVSNDNGVSFPSTQLIIETGSTYPVPAISAQGDHVAITYCGRHEGIYGFVVLTKISHDAGITWSNETIISDTDVSRSGIGPAAVSVTDEGAGFLWIDSRGTWDENVFFDWYDFDSTGDDTTQDANQDDTSSTEEDTPGFGLLIMFPALGILFFIIRRKR